MSELSITQWKFLDASERDKANALFQKLVSFHHLVTFSFLSSFPFLFFPLLPPLNVPLPLSSSCPLLSPLPLPFPLFSPSSSKTSFFGSFRDYILFSSHPTSFSRSCGALHQATVLRRQSRSVSTPGRTWR